MIRRRLLLAAACLAWASGAHGEILGKVRVVDGDSLEVGGQLVDLFGIDAPEETQTCEAGGREWQCGREAAFALAFETAEHWVSCDEVGRAASGAVLGLCRVGPYDLNAIMVRKGWALAEPSRATNYAAEEHAAQAAGAGIWRGTFLPPWEWRAAHGAGAR